MAGKWSEQTLDATVAETDWVSRTKDPAGTPLTRRCTVSDLLGANAEYGEIYAASAGTTQSTINSSTYTKIDQFDTEGVSLGASVSQANDQITLSSAGVYQVSMGLSFSGTASETYTIALHVDGVEAANTKIIRKLGTGGDVGQVAGTTFHSFSGGEVLDLRVKSLAGSGDDFTLESGVFGIHRVV